MVKVENITFSYNRSGKNVLENVGFSIEAGQCLAILGNNGAGKSTLLKCIDRIHPVLGGSVTIDGQNIFGMTGNELARQIAYVPQNTRPVNMTVFDTVLLGRKPYIKWDTTEEDRQIAGRVIHQMGLENYTLRNVSQLSGGEAQKVMLARALTQEPKFLLLDEPTSNLDPKNQHEVLRTVQEIARTHQISVAIIIHDLNLAIRYCDRFLFLKGSQVYAFGEIETMTPETIEAVYGMNARIIYDGRIPVIVPYPDTEEVAI